MPGHLPTGSQERSMHPGVYHYNMLVLHYFAVLCSARFGASGRSKMTTDDRELFDELLDDEEFAPGLTRADVFKRGAAAGAAVWGVSTLFGAQTAFGST